jgi:xyloglucan:xyloglucosyl transferase
VHSSSSIEPREGTHAHEALVVAAAVAGLGAANFRDDCDIPWQAQNAWLSDDGNSLSMQLVSNYSGPVLDLVAFPLADG